MKNINLIQLLKSLTDVFNIEKFSIKINDDLSINFKPIINPENIDISLINNCIGLKKLKKTIEIDDNDEVLIKIFNIKT